MDCVFETLCSSQPFHLLLQEKERTATKDRLQRLTKEGLNQLLDLFDLPKGGTKVRLATSAPFLEADAVSTCPSGTAAQW
jgi:hypothetical protein